MSGSTRGDRPRALITCLLATAFSVASAAEAMAADRFVSTSGSDANACTASAPCRSFDRAYHEAAPGDRVRVSGGSYGTQTFTHDNTKNGATKRVVFEPATSAAVTVGDIYARSGSEDAAAGSSGASAEHIEIRGMGVSDLNLRMAHDMVFDGVDFDGPYFLRSSSNITIRNSDIGPWNDYTSEVTSNGAEASRPSRNIVFENNRFHDVVKVSAGAHTDCMSTGDVDGLTIRGNTFTNCAHFTVILATDYNGKSSRNVLIENNFFEPAVLTGTGISIGETDGPVMIRFNSLGSSISDQRGGSAQIHLSASRSC